MKWKRDSLVQAWVDRRDLATLVLVLKRFDLHPRNASEIVAMALRLIANGEESRITTTHEAIEILGRCNIETNLNPSGRGERNLKLNLLKEEEEDGSVSVSDKEIERIIAEHMKGDLI